MIFQAPAKAISADAKSISAAFGLFLAESRLVALLVSGHTPVESAGKAGIGLNTAKTQLRSDFAKTGFARQADLIGHVLANPVLRIAAKRARV